VSYVLTGSGFVAVTYDHVQPPNGGFAPADAPVQSPNGSFPPVNATVQPEHGSSPLATPHVQPPNGSFHITPYGNIPHELTPFQGHDVGHLSTLGYLDMTHEERIAYFKMIGLLSGM
jgi:hypothetical protein